MRHDVKPVAAICVSRHCYLMVMTGLNVIFLDGRRPSESFTYRHAKYSHVERSSFYRLHTKPII